MCAVVGLIDTVSKTKEVALAENAYQVLTALQHRGQDASGMVSFDQDSGRFYSHKNLGPVSRVYSKNDLNKLQGRVLIGHNRYTTVGQNREWDAQPMFSGFPLGMALAHNGNTLNLQELRTFLQEEKHIQSLSNSDLECFLHLYSLFLSEESSFRKKGLSYQLLVDVSTKILHLINGSYALVGLIANFGLFGLRDPHGIRPLVLGKRNGCYCLASESGGLDFADFTVIRDIKPGECIFIDLKGNIHSTILKQSKRAHCMFEWVYFAGAESFIEGKAVYQSRLNLGRLLGQQIKKLISQKVITPDLISPVPDTGRTAAMALSEVVGLPYRECLIKNRYTQRSFILNSQKSRDEMVQKKLVPIKSEIEGKNILLVDDSIVRGTTSKKIIRLLRKYGVNKVYLASTCPPIVHGCFYGIDFPVSTELVAHGKTIDETTKDIGIGANHVIYLTIENLNKALVKDQMCVGCLTGEYPTDTTHGKYFAENRKKERGI